MSKDPKITILELFLKATPAQRARMLKVVQQANLAEQPKPRRQP